jgi:hypothetical protein
LAESLVVDMFLSSDRVDTIEGGLKIPDKQKDSRSASGGGMTTPEFSHSGLSAGGGLVQNLYNLLSD